MTTHLARLTIGATLTLAVLVACGGDDSTSESDDTDAVGATTAAPVSELADAPESGAVVVDEGEFTYLTDAEGTWVLQVRRPEGAGPWPLIVVIPGSAGVQSNVGAALAARGAVVVSGENWAPDDAWGSDPSLHLYGAMDRAACIVSWAQAHGADYGADPTVTTVTGFSGGAMAATWVGLGLADDSGCDDPVAELPAVLVSGENQYLFHNQRWDPAFESGDPEPQATLNGLLNPELWTVSADLRVGLWSAANPIGETRLIANPPAANSWIWLRDSATPVVEDLTAVAAFDDELIDWGDNARLMEQRLTTAEIDVVNEVYDIGHAYTDEVYDLIFALQPTVE